MTTVSTLDVDLPGARIDDCSVIDRIPIDLAVLRKKPLHVSLVPYEHGKGKKAESGTAHIRRSMRR